MQYFKRATHEGYQESSLAIATQRRHWILSTVTQPAKSRLSDHEEVALPDEHSVHPHHRDFIVTPITDQIGPIDSVSKTEYYDLKNHFSEPQCKMTVLPLNSGNHDLTPVDF
ncbi:hypothetical protein F511_18014 [Dorcoceras hygrometricum]|uniref:Uncharacterized protein n=1 Tax=Dorcoceras hygrometricum TaxID=472368 RepID=A0A2Z7ALN5_9LAMI|nr:hypothetical protein F511_18014 [Dorcoceras hygrometricum]